MRSVCLPDAFSTGLTRTPMVCCFSGLIVTVPADMAAELGPGFAGPPCAWAGSGGIPGAGAIQGAGGATVSRRVYQDPARNAPATSRSSRMPYVTLFMGAHTLASMVRDDDQRA